jgi:hypothetical protein
MQTTSIRRKVQAVSSRLAADGHGGIVVVVTTSTEVGLAPGDRFTCLGNALFAGERGIGWLGAPTGRRATAREAQEARAPYSVPRRLKPAPQPDEDQLDDAEALRLCQLEQRRAPVDLLNAA